MDGAEASGDDVDLTLGDADGECIGAAVRGVICLGGVALGEAEETGIEAVVGDMAALGFDCSIGVGDAFGTSKRPRRCDGVGEVIGVDVAAGAELGATVAARRGAIVCAGVVDVVEIGGVVAATVGAIGALAAVEVIEEVSAD